MNKRLWAPWRRKYIFHSKPRGCIFCARPKSKQDAKNFLLERGKKNFSMLNLYPYNNGHVLIAPYRHVGNPAFLTDAESAELFRMVQDALRRLEKILKPQGYNVGLNIGHAGGAGYDKHIHFHVVPRWTGDTNFMPVLTGDKVISESLGAMRERFLACR